jgi:hypothetical protein
MTRSIKRFFCFAGAVAAGVICFGLWSAKVQAAGTSGGGGTGSYCNQTGNATMCYTPTHTTVNNVVPTQQSIYLSSGKYTCGACSVSGT